MNYNKKITLFLIFAVIILAFGVGITGAYVVSKRNVDNNSIQNNSLAQNSSNFESKPEPIENPDIFGDYMRNMQKKIKLNWNPPSETHSNKVVLIFKINKDGQVPDYKVLNSSGDNAVDSAAIDALLKSAPFEPLPTSYKGKDVQVQFAFDYNVFKNIKPTSQKRFLVIPLNDYRYRKYFRNLESNIDSYYNSKLSAGEYVIMSIQISQEGKVIGTTQYTKTELQDRNEYNTVMQASPFGQLPEKIDADGIEIYLKFDNKGCKLIESKQLKDII